jgi:DNA invertase Pin-like site-specific DNA recombinase
VRVSGRGQIDGDGPQRQRDAIQQFCGAQGIGRFDFFTEEAVSGTIDGLSRPVFLQMIQEIEAVQKDGSSGEVCIVLERMDRLARDLIVSEVILKECAARGIPVYAADQGQKIDQASVEADPTRKLIRQIMGALSEWEKSVIVKKLRAARDRKRQETGRCEGVKPYGSEPGEEVTLALMRERRKQGVSFSCIAGDMNFLERYTRKDKPWTKAAAYQVLKHP